MTTAYLGLGSNLGDREDLLRRALRALSRHPDIAITGVSSVYETDPVGPRDQPPFLNLVLRLETGMKARELLEICRSVEDELGRVRKERWGPRVIDVDILLFGSEIVDEPELVIPHPEMSVRAFVLIPLAELEPAMALPQGDRVADSLARLDSSGVRRYPGLDLRAEFVDEEG